MKEMEKIVMEDSPEAASIKTVTGWVSRLGHFFGNAGGAERTARYDGCTHVACRDCGKAVTRGWLSCADCRGKAEVAKFCKLERKPWDGKTPLALHDSDTYFFDEGDIEVYCDDHDVKAEDLRLVFCYPVKPGKLHAGDMFADELPEDGDCDDPDILAAIDALNKAIEKAEPFSWLPGNVAAVLSEAKPPSRGGEEIK